MALLSRNPPLRVLGKVWQNDDQWWWATRCLWPNKRIIGVWCVCVRPNDDKTLNAVKFTNLSNHLNAQDWCSLGWEEQSEGWECYLREIFSRAIFSQQSFHEQYFHSRCTLGCHSADWEEGADAKLETIMVFLSSPALFFLSSSAIFTLIGWAY